MKKEEYEQEILRQAEEIHFLRNIVRNLTVGGKKNENE